MTRDDIIRMAREASAVGDGLELSGDAIERFAALVAAAEREQVAAEVALALKVGMPHDMLLDAIRKRGAL